MLPYFVFDHFQIGSVTIYVWGLFVGLGFLAGYLLALGQAKKRNFYPETIPFLAIIVFLGAAVGARFLFLLQVPIEFLNDIFLLGRINQGGLMIWGGILGGLISGWLYLKIKRINFWEMADIFAAPAALGIAIGRIGCFLVNDHQGAPTNLPWGILWPDGIARHPVALYEILAMFGLFFVLLWLQRRSLSVIPAKAGIQKLWIPAQGRDDKSGQLFLIFLISYTIIRFLLDFFRVSAGPLADPRFWGLFTSQWVSILILLACGYLWPRVFLRQ